MKTVEILNSLGEIEVEWDCLTMMASAPDGHGGFYFGYDTHAPGNDFAIRLREALTSLACDVVRMRAFEARNRVLQ